MAALVGGLLAGYGIAIPVGAIATYLVGLTARTTWRVGVFAALGVATADGLYALVATLGGAALTHALRPVLLPVRWGAAVVLMALALRGAATAVARHRRHGGAGSDDRTAAGAAHAYLSLLGLTMMNPTTVVYFAALVLGSPNAAGSGLRDRALFVLAAFAVSASWQLLLAGGGALLGRTVTGVRGRLVTALTSSALIGAFAVHLLTTAG